MSGWSLAELAEKFEVQLRGNPGQRIYSLQGLKEAGPDSLSFLANRRYLDLLKTSNAGAVLLHPSYADAYNGNVLLTEQPYLLYARISQLLEQSLYPELPGSYRHPGAQVAESAQIAAGVRLGPCVVVGERAVIGAGTVLEAGVVVGDDCSLGAGCHLYPHVVLYPRTQLGQCVRIQAGSIIGADGFGFAPSANGWVRIAQLGRVVIGDYCDIGANTTIDRAAMGETWLGRGGIVDNQVQIAHNVRIGDYTAIAACTGISGSTDIGQRCILAGGVGLVGHIQIADGVQLTGMTMVTKSIEQAGSYSSGTAFEPTAQWKKTAVRLKNLEQMQRKLTILEKELLQLQTRQGSDDAKKSRKQEKIKTGSAQE